MERSRMCRCLFRYDVDDVNVIVDADGMRMWMWMAMGGWMAWMELLCGGGRGSISWGGPCA